MKKTIVIFSNPFGYGPTGNAIPVIRGFLEQVKDAEVIFAGSDLCMEIVSELPVKTVRLDERDENTIEAFLKKIENPYVIGSQNRFCIRVAKRLGIPCAFIDILAWFWKDIPEDHLLADEIFWIKFPNIEKKIPDNHENIHLVSSIITTLNSSLIKSKQLTIHIGGAKYPLADALPLHYLNLISKGLNALSATKDFDRILFVGGSEAIDYLKQKVTAINIILGSLPKDKFIVDLERSAHMITTAGVSSSLESFSLKVPVSFMLPMNLSHIGLTDMLRKYGACPQFLDWQDYVSVNPDLRNMTEKDAIAEIGIYAKTVDENTELSNKFVGDFLHMAQSIPVASKQHELIKYMGESGSDEIVNILNKKWFR